MSDEINLIIAGVIAGGSFIGAGIALAINYFSSIKFEEKELKIIFNYLEEKYGGKTKNDLIELTNNLIKGNKFLFILSDKMKKLNETKTQEKKKIFLLGETGVGKSTLINCLEEKMVAIEATLDAPTTMDYKEYESKKFKNYIFCDTRGIEKNKNNIHKIENENINKILNNIKDYSYLFWFLKGSSTNFQDTDAKFIKSLESSLSLNGNIPLFFIITRSIDDEKDKERLNNTIKEYFPYIKNIPIFPLLARDCKRMHSYGLNELMNETKNYFGEILIEKYFENIYETLMNFITKFSKELKNKSIDEIFKIILNYIRLEKITNEINNDEKTLITNFIREKYDDFKSSNFTEILKLCSLIKSKYEVINMNKDEKISSNLTRINNNPIELNNEANYFEKKILLGCSISDKEKIVTKAEKYKSSEKMQKEVEKIIKIFFGYMFNVELKKQIKDNLLRINGLFD